jgi:competence protein ComFC
MSICQKIKTFFSEVQEVISLIFFEKQYKGFSGDFQNETDHYHKELSECFMDSVYIASSYKQIRSLLEAYKYRSERENGDIFWKILSQSPLFWTLLSWQKVCIVPVPMHWSRYIIRGYNHIELLSGNLSRLTHIPTSLILWTTFSFRQSKLSKSERMKNRKWVFFIKKGTMLPDIVILLDDVISTWITANECAKILKNAWVKKVHGLFLASNRD